MREESRSAKDLTGLPHKLREEIPKGPIFSIIFFDKVSTLGALRLSLAFVQSQIPPNNRALHGGFFSRSLRVSWSAGLTSPRSRRGQPTGSKEEHLDEPHNKMVIANSIASGSKAAWRSPSS